MTSGLAYKTAHLMDLVAEEIPLQTQEYDIGDKKSGLVIVDTVNGFCTPGAGNLAPPSSDPFIDGMVKNVGRIAGNFASIGWPIFVLMDHHLKEDEEHPYPSHCVVGTGEEELIPRLKWLHSYAGAVLLEKHCINGFVAATHGDGSNAMVDWINDNELESVLVVGICTDICDMDLVLTLLSVRNHGMVPTLKDIVVIPSACATYDLPREVAEKLNLPKQSIHPRHLTGYMGLYFMFARGAILASKLQFNGLPIV